MPPSEFEGVNDQTRPCISHCAVCNEVGEKRESHRDGGQCDQAKLPPRPNQGFPHGLSRFELHGHVRDPNAEGREDSVVLLEADGQTDEHSYPDEIPGPGLALPRKQALHGRQGE